MTALAAFLRDTIAAEGPISVERFMSLALGHPRHGYYMTRDPFGVAGDFVTSPEISQMFGELIGLWAADLWIRMGRPAPVRIVELGPGRGTLMADFLRAGRVVPGFLPSVDLHLVETSPMLVARQRATLADAPTGASWVRRLDEVPPGPAIVIANEYFDALPIRQYVRASDGWRERLVGLDASDELTFAAAPSAEPALTVPAPIGALLEVGAAAQDEVERLARRLRDGGGGALIVDYGGSRSGVGETLQALYRGAPIHPLQHPGDADVTAHVDFAALARAARRAGACVDGPVDQGVFLQRLGIEQRAERLARTDDAARLIDRSSPTAMGALFKVICVRSPICPEPAGLEASS